MSLPTSRFEVPSWHVVFGRPIFFTTEITEILGSFFGFPFSVFLLVGKTNRSTSPLNKNYFYVLGIWSSENLGRQSWNLSFFILEAIQPAKTGLWAMRRGSQQSHFGGHESCSWLFGDNLNKKSSGNRYQHRELGTTPLFRKRCLVNASTSSNSSFSSNKNLLVFFLPKNQLTFWPRKPRVSHGFTPPKKRPPFSFNGKLSPVSPEVLAKGEQRHLLDGDRLVLNLGQAWDPQDGMDGMGDGKKPWPQRFFFCSSWRRFGDHYPTLWSTNKSYGMEDLSRFSRGNTSLDKRCIFSGPCWFTRG